MSKNKGIVLPILAVIVTIIVAGVGIAGSSYLKQAEETSKEQADYFSTINIKQATEITGAKAVLGQPGCKYGYENIKPYVNFFTQDDQGTATNPTWYYYEAKPSEYWGDERTFTDESDLYVDSGTSSSGKLSKQFAPGTELWAHASISSYEDIFWHGFVPTCGDITPGDAQDTNNGITINTWETMEYDTTAWTSSALDLATTNTNGTETKSKLVSYVIADNKKAKIDRIEIRDIQKYADERVSKIKFKVGNSGWLKVYDYDAGLENFKYDGATNKFTYSSNDWHKDTIRNLAWVEDEVASFHVEVTVYATDVGEADADSMCSDGEAVGAVYIYDAEGNLLINAKEIDC